MKPMAHTPEQRTAQRKLVGTLNTKNHMWFDPTGDFCIWRDQRASTEWGAGIPELSANFDTLEIPYVVRPEVVNVSKSKKKAGFTLVVLSRDLPALTRWMPSFQKNVDRVRAELEALSAAGAVE
jgi:hypothetical protein